MLPEGQWKKFWRVGSWGVIAILSIVSLVLFYLNYQKLDQVVQSAEQNAIHQSQNIRYYSHQYQVTKVALDEANEKIIVLTKQLEMANAELNSARNELASIQEMNDELKADIAVLERYKMKEQSLEVMIRAFKRKNKELDSALQSARKELSTFQPDIRDLQEGKAKIKLFKKQVHQVKRNMAAWKHTARQIRIASQKERDRVEALYGNGGFLVKDGEDKSVTNFRERAVQIDVKFLNP